MPWLTGKTSFVLLLAILISGACKKEYSCENCIPDNNSSENRSPLANAGTDQIVTLPINEITLDGSLSTDPDGNIVIFSWITISGPSTIAFANANAAKTRAGNLVEGEYQFELQVTDNGGLKSKDTVTIIVRPVSIASRWTRLESAGQPDFWTFYSPVTDENVIVGIRDEIYAVNFKGDLWRYPWTKVRSLPGFAPNIQVTVTFSIGDIGYFIGAGDSWQYDIVSHELTKKTNTPVGDHRVDKSISFVIGNKAYLVSSINNHVTVYDPVTDTYTQRNNYPGDSVVTGFLIGEDGYCVEEDGKCWKYNHVTDQWQQKATLPPLIYYKSGFGLNGYGYILGDLNHEAYTGTDHIKLWQYYPDSDIWEQLNDDYPGAGVSLIRTISLNEIVYVGFGYTNYHSRSTDFWSFR